DHVWVAFPLVPEALRTPRDVWRAAQLHHHALMPLLGGAAAPDFGEIVPIAVGEHRREVEAGLRVALEPGFEALAALDPGQAADVLNALEKHIVDAHECRESP